jgi:iron complex outermembrane receptor protein
MKLNLTWGFFLLSSLAYPQHEYMLEPVNVYAQKCDLAQIGFLNIELDSFCMRRNYYTPLAQVLSFLPSIQVRSYGAGNIAGLSIRGGSLAQTAVVWNGINLQNLFNGQADVSIINNLENYQCNLQLGGSSQLIGSGAIAGVLHINHRAILDTIHHLLLSIQTSFHDLRTTHLKYQLGLKKVQVMFSPYLNEGENTYPIYNSATGNVEKQKNAAIRLVGYHSSFSVQVPQTRINFYSWVQDAKRQVPNPIHLTGFANQKDFFSRNLVTIDRTISHTIFNQIRIGHIAERLLYSDIIRKIYSPFNLQQILVENDISLNVKRKHKFLYGIHLSQSVGENVNHLNFKNKRVRWANFFNYSINLEKVGTITLSSVYEQNNQIGSPLCPSMAFKSRVIKFIILEGSLSKTYRMPTFNDLYWAEGGNQNLKPEVGFNKEIGLTALGKFAGNHELKIGLRAYQRNVKDWILWLPEGGVWRALNIEAVNAKGFEVFSLYAKTYNNTKLKIEPWYSFTQTLNETGENAGKYLLYVSPFSWGFNITVTHKKASLLFQALYNAWRFITSDNSEFLDPYFVCSSSFFWDINLFRIFFEVNNLSNTRYETVANYPMPLRNFRIGVSRVFNLKVSKHKH